MQRRGNVEFVAQRNMAPFVMFVAFVLLLVAGTFYQSQCGDVPDARKAAVSQKATSVMHESPQEPEIIVTEVASGVYHLDFDGYSCSDATCMKRAFGLMHAQAPGSRIIDVEPIVEYGSPTALIVVTAPAP